MSAADKGPKEEPGFDTQALLRVSVDSEMGRGRKKKKAPKGGPPWPWIGVGVGALVFGLGVAVWIRSQPADVVSVPLEPAASVTSVPDPAGTPPPSPSASAVAASPTASASPSLRASEVPVPVPDRDPPRSARPGKSNAPAPSGPDDVDRALEKLSNQSGDELMKAGNIPLARAAYAKECDESKVPSCVRLAQLLKSEAGDEAGVKDAYGKACRKRSADGCLGLASVSSGREINEALEAACDLASLEGCKKAAERVEQNGGPEARANSLRARACELGDAQSCPAKTKTSSGGEDLK